MMNGSFSGVDYSFLGIEGLRGDKPVKVTNISPKVVSYLLPELMGDMARTFRPATSTAAETKTIQFHELFTLAQSLGGMQIIYDNLLIESNEIRKALGLPEDPEFDYTYEDIKKIVQEGTKEEILDAIEFGPFYIVEWAKNIIVTEGLNDYSKRKFFSTLFNMNLDRAQENFEWATDNEKVGSQYKEMSGKAADGGRQRRSSSTENAASTKPVRRAGKK